MEQMVKTLWDSVTAQGNGLYKVEALLQKIANALNAQGNGLRQAEARIARLEQILNQKVPVTRFEAPRLEAVNPVEDDEEDFDYDRDENYEEQ